MQRFVKGIPFLLACILAFVIFKMAGQDPPKISAHTLEKLQAKYPNSEVAPISAGNSLQYESYGKPIKHQFRLQAFKPGTVEFYDADGKAVLKMFVEQGDVLVTVPKHKSIEAYVFEPFQWFE